MAFADKHSIGTEAWYRGEARYAVLGTVDCILRLLEQGAVTRSKARELVAYATGDASQRKDGLPEAPWDDLYWGRFDGPIEIAEMALQAAYRKHHLGDESIGWEELGEALQNALCAIMGDTGYQEWMKEIRLAGGTDGTA